MRFLPAGRTPETEIARALLARGEFAAAADRFERLLVSAARPELMRRARRGATAALIQLGLLRFHAGQDTEAGAHFARALRWSPGCARARGFHARVLHRAGRCGESAAELERALEGAPGDDADVWMLLALCRHEAGDESGVAPALHRALALLTRRLATLCAPPAPESFASRRLVADAPAGALAVAARAVAERPSSADRRLGLARALIEAGATGAAAVEVERALRIHPRHLEALALKAWLRLRHGKHDAAAVILEQVIPRLPHDAHLHFWLGLAHWRSGDPDAAIGALERAVGLDRHFARAQRVLGLLYHGQGRRAEALRALRLGMIRDREPERSTLSPLEDLAWACPDGVGWEARELERARDGSEAEFGVLAGG
jgi:tetratricopeptide (TPR) repeat protein